MIKHLLQAQNRTLTGRSVKRLRSQGIAPANIFGKKIPSVSIQVSLKDFDKLRHQVGESTLLYLRLEGEKDERPVLVRDVVIHPVTGKPLHLSFNQVNLKEKVIAPVPVNLTGEAPAEQEKLGILVQQLDEVEIEALPTDIPEGLEVDVSSLTEVGASLSVKDLSVDHTKITIKTDPEAILVKIEPLAAEEKVEIPVATEVPVEGESTSTEAPVSPPTAAPETPPEKK